MKSAEIQLEKQRYLNLNESLKYLLNDRLTSGDNNTNSDFTFRLAEWWLQTCKKTHTQCNLSSAVLPARVIDVGAADGSQEPFLHESEGQESAYVALSYCWGNTIPLTTTEATLALRKAGIALSSMPKAYQDAVVIARRFKIRYLWIDALCIIQDSFKDWEAHSARMCSIYQHATFTIANLHARNPLEGCFIERDGLTNHPYLFSRAEHKDLVLSWAATAVPSVTQSPLLERAWVLQEQLLSPRTLSYSADGISWHCVEAKATERAPCMSLGLDSVSIFQQSYISSSKNNKSNIDAERALQSGKVKFLKTTDWHDIVQEYTNRTLTKDKDKLAAILGISNAMTTSIVGEFVAGLCAQTLSYDVLWSISVPRHQSRHTNSRPQTFVAPSWSWASVTCPVRYPRGGEPIIWTSSISTPQLEGTPSNQKGKLPITAVTRTGYTLDSGVQASNRLEACQSETDVTSTTRTKLHSVKWRPDEDLPPSTQITFLEIGRTADPNSKEWPPHYHQVLSIGLVPTEGGYRRVGFAVFPFTMVRVKTAKFDPLGLSDHLHIGSSESKIDPTVFEARCIEPENLKQRIQIAKGEYWDETVRKVEIW